MSFCFMERIVDKKGVNMFRYHSHPYHEIYFLIDGERTIYTEHDYYELNGNALVFFPPNALHKTEGKNFVRININVDDEYLDPFQKDILHLYAQQIIQIETEELPELLHILDKLEDAQENEKNAKRKDYFVRIYFSYLLLSVSKLKNFPKKATVPPTQAIPILAKKVIHYLNEHYNEKITLDQLSAKFFTSKVTICKTFKKATNMSVADYLLALKIHKAKELLINTNKKISDISQICGFSSQNYFSLIFKQKEKMSPLNYKKYCLT